MTPADALDAREWAGALVAAAAGVEPELVRLRGVDLAGALEQQLFFALRDRRRARRGLPGVASALAVGRSVGAAGLGMAGALQRPPVEPGGVLVLIREPTHDPVVARLAIELAADGTPLATVRAGRAAGVQGPEGVLAARLQWFVGPRDLPALWRLQSLMMARIGHATAGWPAIAGETAAADLRRLVQHELPRIGLGATALAAAVRRWRPALLIAFDEVGTWARLLPAVARAAEIASLDLPHAEAADATAIRGAGYDRLAVYGPRAAEVLRAAGIDGRRVVQIGAPRFDPLVQATLHRPAATERRRIVFAAQYVTGKMTRELLSAAQQAAFESARAVAPAELVVVPHPAAVDELSLPEPMSGVGVRVARDGLHAELPGAWLLVTGWSNSVLEAAIAGVPAVTVAPPGMAPVDFASDGLSTNAADPPAAAAQALRLLEPEAHRATVDRARAALERRLGPLDGAATKRAAALVRELIGGRVRPAT